MALLTAERIKLVTTRSPWWCVLLAVVLTVGFSAMIASNSGATFPASVAASQAGWKLGLVVIMVMSALAVTTEYRTGTIRTTFQAAPNRVKVLLSKTAVVATIALIVGEVTAFASWAVANAICHGELALQTEQHWRNVAGMGLIYGLGGILAVAVGILLRHTAGAIAVLLIYVLLVESLVPLVPTVGEKLHRWLPFTMAGSFLDSGADAAGRGGAAAPMAAEPALGPWWSLLYFAGFVAIVLCVALVSAHRRDA